MKKQTNLQQRAAAVAQEMRDAGISVAGWADTNGFSRASVTAVLTGRSSCLRGAGHQIAVALGIKTGQVVKTETFKPAHKPTVHRSADLRKAA